MNEPEEQKPSSSGNDLEPVSKDHGSWDMVLTRAAEDVPARPAAEARPFAASPAVRWVKLLFPLLVVGLFVSLKVYEYVSERPGSYHRSAPEAAPESLTGVSPEQAESVSMDRKTKEFVAKLEAMQSRDNWAGILGATGAAEAEPFREHPVVQALTYIARTRTGERELALESDLKEMETLLAQADRYPELLREVRLARVEQILSRATSLEVLSRNTDEIIRLLEGTADYAREADVRIRSARTFEYFGDQLLEQGDGYISNDVLKIREARVYFQTALRLITKPDEWAALGPISPRAKAEIDRLVEKIRQCNRMIHGIPAPFSGNDSSTWSGKKGDPVHYQAR